MKIGMPNSLESIIFVLVVAGLILWAISQFQLDGTVAKLIKVVVVVVASMMVLHFLLGLMSSGWFSLPPRR